MRVFVALLGAVLLSGPLAANASPPTQPPTSDFGSYLTTGGVHVEGETQQQGTPAADHQTTARHVATAPRRESAVVPACGSNRPDSLDLDATCAQSVRGCVLLGRGSAPMTWIFVRLVNQAPGSQPTPWQFLATSCNQPVTARPAQPVLTLAMVQRAFRDLDFARPRVRIQPEGTTTLVNLPTYYRITWPAAGVAPAEAARLTLLGHRVTITPSVTTYRYLFGDRETLGPTADPGGTYPTGGVTHTYRQPGIAPAHAQATYTATFSVDDGPAQPVDDTVTITGPVTALTVRQAAARLEAGHR